MFIDAFLLVLLLSMLENPKKAPTRAAMLTKYIDAIEPMISAAWLSPVALAKMTAKG